MRLDQLQIGTVDVFDVRPDGDVPQGWGAGLELELSFHRDVVQLASGGESLVVRSIGQAARTLDRLAQQRLPRVVRLADLSKKSLRLQIHSFPSAKTMDLHIGVDERALESAQRIRRSIRSVEAMLGWLRDQCLLDGDVPRAFLSAGHTKDLGDHFVMHGRNLRVRVKRIRRAHDDAETLQVVKLTRGRGTNDRHPITLASGDIRFLNHTEAHRLRVEARAQLEEIRATETSFMGWWKRYGEIEGEQILRRARTIGILHYSGVERLADGSGRFFLEGGKELGDALAELRPGDVLEVAEDAPEVLSNAAASWSDFMESHKKRERRRSLSAEAHRRGEWRARAVILRPKDPEGFYPPSKGVLHLSLVGDATRLERREKARELLWSDAAPMPQLPLLLECRQTSSRVLHKAKLPASVRRRVFPKHPPTKAQLDAIITALESPDLAIIQGPPGTGKTTVIRAIVECLNEQSGQGAGPGRILVTGFQHVAVENAIGKMLVNGLPPIKLGGGDLDAIDQRIESWRQERVTRVRERLPDQEEDEHRRLLHPLVESYLLTPTPPARTHQLLGEVERLVGHLLPSALARRLRDLRTSLDDAPRDGHQAGTRQALQALRALRSSRTAWDDDGARNLLRVLALARRGGVLEEEETRALSRVDREQPTDADLEKVASVRRSALLRMLNAAEQRSQGATIRADVAGLLVDIRESVEASTRPRHLGPDAVVARFVEELESDAVAVRRAVLAYTPVYAATCQQAASRDAATAKGSSLRYEDVIVDEAARANPLDLLVPMAQAGRRIVLVGDHLQLPHMVDDKILDELAEGVEEDLHGGMSKAIQDSLFERLFTDLDGKEPPRVITLRDQFRMHPDLGAFVSREFYDGRLRNGIRSVTPFAHGLSEFGTAAAVWVEVPATEGTEIEGRSKARTAEVKRIADLLPGLMSGAVGKGLTFGVISFYSKQVNLLGKELARHGLMEPNGNGGFQVAEEWRWLTNPDGEREPRLQVGTVDAFQGREFDVVFLSVTRSNPLPDNTPRQRQRKYGHLMSLNRLCVAMSRQKRVLVAVGDPGLLEAPNAADAIGPLVRFHKLCGGQRGLRL